MRVGIADGELEVVAHLKLIVQDLGHEAVGFVESSALTQALSKKTTFDLVILD